MGNEGTPNSSRSGRAGSGRAGSGGTGSEGDIGLPGGGILRTSRDRDGDGPRSPAFSDLVQPFFVMGLVALGIVPDPESGESQVDLDRAFEAIETLELLREKTRGHLDDAEERLLKQVIYDLRIHYEGAQERSGEE